MTVHMSCMGIFVSLWSSQPVVARGAGRLGVVDLLTGVGWVERVLSRVSLSDCLEADMVQFSVHLDWVI